jgi:hypothetical protein
METLSLFATILAVWLGTWSTIVIFFKFYMHANYTPLQRAIDASRGFTVSYMHNLILYVILACISWAWILTVLIMRP